MTQASVVIISGPPGAGKSSVSKRLAEHSAYERAVHMHTDDFYHFIRKGYIAPWLSESHEQNTVIIEAFTASAARLAIGGYEVIVDGIVGPWFLAPWLKMAQDGFDVRYIILRPVEQTAVSRAVKRGGETLTDAETVRRMWRAFADLGPYEPHVIDTTTQSIDETALSIRKLLGEGTMRIV
ncbi:MAG: ATP-binding protein [Acidaminococcales bacterium]|nr:ATP-binding protein [Acidaminococcales bacterium]